MQVDALVYMQKHNIWQMTWQVHQGLLCQARTEVTVGLPWCGAIARYVECVVGSLVVLTYLDGQLCMREQVPRPMSHPGEARHPASGDS